MIMTTQGVDREEWVMWAVPSYATSLGHGLFQANDSGLQFRAENTFVIRLDQPGKPLLREGYSTYGVFAAPVGNVRPVIPLYTFGVGQ